MKKLLLLLMAVMSMSVLATAQSRTVKGIVVDAATDEPLIGVSVTPVGEALGVVTDIDGNFHLQVGPNVKELTFSYVGYNTVTLPVKDKMTVSMTPSSQTLDALVVTGYGSGKKLGSVVGSVSVIGSAALENVTTPSFVDALQGKVAGLSVFSNSGDPSSVENSIRLRGVNSLNSSNTPLFILDGAPVTQTVFATINPNDIESITVLKDAASVAIYGSRAANGVIVITSKRGKYAEKANVSIRAKYGFSQMTPDKMDMMGSADYVKYRDLIGKPVNDEQRYAAETLGINTDWRKEIFNGHAPTYSLEAAISGGTETLNYYISVNHLQQQGIIIDSDMRRETIRTSITSRATDWLRVGIQTNLGYTKFQTNTSSDAIYQGGGVYLSNPMTLVRMALPMDSPRYWTRDENGNVVWGDKAQYLHFTGLASLEYLSSNRYDWNNRVTANMSIFEEITPVKGLTIRFQQALDGYDVRSKYMSYAHDPLFTPMGDSYGVSDANENGIIEGSNQQGFGRYYQFTYTNTAEYRTKFLDNHNVSVLVGEESIIQKSENFSAASTGQIDRRQPLLSQGTDTKIGYLSQNISEITMNSVFGSLSYNFAEKYFFDFNLRGDGSSRFPKGKRWAMFFSVGGMWDVKQEKFLQPLTWLDTARLRVTYGSTGNSSFANYAYFGLISNGGLYQGTSGLTIAQPSNYDLSWESVSGLDVGLNVGLFNKLKLDVAFYNKNTNNMIVEVPYSMTTGVAGNWGNMASMRNTGVDLDIDYTIMQTRDWYVGVHANLNYNRNQITKLFNDLDELPLPNAGIIYKKGHTANEYYIVRWAGVDPRDGAQMWYTREGNLTKTYNEERDAVCISGKSPYAPWGGGFGTDLAWKGISLKADFTWAAGKYMQNNDRYFCENNNFATSYNQMTSMLNVWTHPGQVTNIPAPGQTLQFDTHLLENASFVRLKTLSLQYAFPRSITQKLHIDGLKVHATGRNLLTFTGYTGYDPEPETNVVAFFYPNTRQYEFGIDVAF